MDTEVRASAEVDAAWPQRRYAWYVVGVLTAAYTLSYIDRQILGLVLEPLRQDLSLTDTQVSLLAGTAFALFYVTLGLPLGWIADRASRRKLIALGVFFWSLMTAMCGLASTFWQLFAARMGVGVGEAALSPAAYSIISDYFPPEARVRPLATYNVALAIGSGLAYLTGGAISSLLAARPGIEWPLFGELASWQATFVAVGAPGMLFALLVLTIREPVRRGIRRAAVPAQPRSTGVRELVRFICVENPKTFAVIFFGYGGLAMHSVSVTIWMPTLFVRRFGWTTGEIGLAMGGILLVFATLGILAGMNVAARLHARGSADGLLRTSLYMGTALVPLGIALPLCSTPGLTLALLAPVAALSFGIFAVVPPVLQLITPNQMRAQIAAVFSLFNNVIGLMIGATYVALITDYVLEDSSRLHVSLAITAATVLPASCLLLWWGLAHFGRSMIAARAWLTQVRRDGGA
jgi:MFS family permease